MGERANETARVRERERECGRGYFEVCARLVRDALECVRRNHPMTNEMGHASLS